MAKANKKSRKRFPQPVTERDKVIHAKVWAHRAKYHGEIYEDYIK